jgi:hypothetical protein
MNFRLLQFTGEETLEYSRKWAEVQKEQNWKEINKVIYKLIAFSGIKLRKIQN